MLRKLRCHPQRAKSLKVTVLSPRDGHSILTWFAQARVIIGSAMAFPTCQHLRRYVAGLAARFWPSASKAGMRRALKHTMGTLASAIRWQIAFLRPLVLKYPYRPMRTFARCDLLFASLGLISPGCLRTIIGQIGCSDANPLEHLPLLNDLILGRSNFLELSAP